MEITLSKGGTKERRIDITTLHPPDMWFISQGLANEGREESSEMVLECWHLCADLVEALREINSTGEYPETERVSRDSCNPPVTS